MHYVPLGNSDLLVSRICMGCMGFGNATAGQHKWVLDEDASRSIILKGLELGINFFDTAAAYQSGTSEQYLGRALKDYTRRDQVVVATKFLPITTAQRESGITAGQHISSMLEQSLRNLDTDYIDLYIMHAWDYHTPIYETMEALHQAVHSGKVRAIGISNCYAYQLVKANSLAESEGFSKFVSVQGHYNLIFREEEREMAKLCSEENIAMTPYSALAAGRLARLPEETTQRLEKDIYAKGKYDASAFQDEKIIRRVAELATMRNVSMSEISLAWLLTKVTAPVVGATQKRHVESAVKAVELQLSPEEIAYLEAPYVPHKLVGMMA